MGSGDAWALLILPLGKGFLGSLQCQHPSAALAWLCQLPSAKDLRTTCGYLYLVSNLCGSARARHGAMRDTPEVLILCSFPACFKRHIVILHCRKPWNNIGSSRAPSLAPFSDLGKPHFSALDNGNAQPYRILVMGKCRNIYSRMYIGVYLK